MTTELSTHVGDGLVWDNINKTIDADFGSGAGKITQGNDARLSDARTPTAHASTHAPGQADAIATGTTAVTVCIGNDARLSDSRAPNGSAGGDLSGSYPNPAVAKITTTSGPTSLTVGAIADGQVLRRSTTNVTGITIGSGAGTLCAGDDSRLSDARTPSAHAASHLPGGADALTTAAAGTISPDDSAATGSAASFARSDHRHAITCAVAGTISPDDAAAEGVATSFARSDHTHAITCAVAGTIAPDNTAAEGVATSFARSDHRHAIAAASASANPPGTSSAEGSSSSFARADHTHALAAFGTGSGTFCEGNDSRLATTFPSYVWYADHMDNPVTSDWAVNSLAAASACTNNSGLLVRRFANATENGVGIIFPIPTAATNIVFGFKSRAETTPAGTVAVIARVYVREFPDNAAVESWSAGTDLTALSFPTSELWQYDSQSIALSTLSLVGGRTVQVELTRRGSDGSDTLTVDWTLLSIEVSFS